MKAYPRARSEGLVTEEVGGELVVYDEATHTAHALSKDAASVWRYCDGHSSDKDIARRVGLEQARVAQALDALSGAELLEAPEGISRREAYKRAAKVGAAAVSAPLIYSVAIGPASAHASAPFTCANLELSQTGAATFNHTGLPSICPGFSFATCYLLGFGQPPDGDFGSRAAMLTLTNNGGVPSGPLTLALTNTDTGFTLSNNGCNVASLAPGASCTFGVTWSPSPDDCPAQSIRMAFVIVSGAEGGCLRLNLQGMCPLL